MRHIVVSKLGNEPDIFGTSLRCGMIGDWETRQLIKALLKDKNNFVTYYGKAKWDTKKAFKEFGPNAFFIESNEDDNPKDIVKLHEVDEFHIVLGPHAFYNGGGRIPSWDSIKESIVTKRMLERVAPQIKLMNACSYATCYFYLSDRRFLLQAADLQNNRVLVLGQNLQEVFYDRATIKGDYATYEYDVQKCKPFRFETLWLLDKTYQDFNLNLSNCCKRSKSLVIPANQVTSDVNIQDSRLSKAIDFTTPFIGDNVTICGKWTHTSIHQYIDNKPSWKGYLDGLDLGDYYNLLKQNKYALVLFNTNDSPKQFIDNWLTVKYWECAYNGCLTFIETDYKMRGVPDELQVLSGVHLYDIIDKCEKDPKYFEHLLELQKRMLKEEYFTGEYFNNVIEQTRHIN